MLDPKGRVVLISGANRGIGLALTRTLYAHGYTLSLGARDAASLARLAAEMDPARVHTAPSSRTAVTTTPSTARWGWSSRA